MYYLFVLKWLGILEVDLMLPVNALYIDLNLLDPIKHLPLLQYLFLQLVFELCYIFVVHYLVIFLVCPCYSSPLNKQFTNHTLS